MFLSSITPEIQREFDSIHRSIKALQSEILKKSSPRQKEYYRPSEVCQLLGISRTKFERFKKEGMFTTRKVGGSVYVAAVDIEKFLPKTK